MTFLLLVFFLVAAFLAVLLRSSQLRRRTYQVPEQIIPGVFSKSLAELAGVAGGIYLSLVMLVSFLQIELPQTVIILGVGMDPLATVSILLAILEPLVMEIYERIKG